MSRNKDIYLFIFLNTTPTAERISPTHTQLVVQYAEVLQALGGSVGQASKRGRRHQAQHEAGGQPLQFAGVGHQLHEKLLHSAASTDHKESDDSPQWNWIL